MTVVPSASGENGTRLRHGGAISLGPGAVSTIAMGADWLETRWWSMRAEEQQASAGEPQANAEATGATTSRATAKTKANRLYRKVSIT